MASERKGYNTPKVELIKIDDSDLILTSQGNGQHGDVGHGKGHGGGCDHVPGHGTPKKPKTFSNAKHGCY